MQSWSVVKSGIISKLLVCSSGDWESWTRLVVLVGCLEGSSGIVHHSKSSKRTEDQRNEIIVFISRLKSSDFLKISFFLFWWSQRQFYTWNLHLYFIPMKLSILSHALVIHSLGRILFCIPLMVMTDLQYGLKSSSVLPSLVKALLSWQEIPNWTLANIFCACWRKRTTSFLLSRVQNSVRINICSLCVCFLVYYSFASVFFCYLLLWIEYWVISEQH